MLPYFNKVERDIDFGGPYHGKDGRIPVRRIPRDKWTGLAKAVAEACELGGEDVYRGPERRIRDGYFPITIRINDRAFGRDRLSR